MIAKALRRVGETISQDDVLGSWLRRLSTEPFAATESTAVGVFRINQRLLFYAVAGLLLVVLWLLMAVLTHPAEALHTLALLTVGWFLGFLATAPLYASVMRGQHASGSVDPLARVSERLFQVDCLILV